MPQENFGSGYFARRPGGIRSCSIPPMSKDKTSSPDASPKRRAPQSRSGKQTKSAGEEHSVTVDSGEETSSSGFPVFDLSDPAPSSASPKLSATGEISQTETTKRKRRRKKGKGGSSQSVAQPVGSDAPAEMAENSSAADSAPAPRPVHQPRLKLDSEAVAKLAWKIYLAEVSEEGVALIGDSDAKELSRRCFRLAEIFMEEQARRS